MPEFLEPFLSGPPLPATVLLLLVCAYWLFVMLGALDLDFLNFDVEMDADVDVDADVDLDGNLDVEPGSITSFGFVALRFLNLSNVPLMLWVSMFSLSFWTLAMVLDDPVYHEDLGRGALMCLGYFGVSLFMAKLLTQPLRGKFEPTEPNPAKGLIGKTCEITTLEVTPTTGQARCRAEGAPLVLQVRTHEGVIAKDDEAEIVGFDSENNIYFVAKVTIEVEK